MPETKDKMGITEDVHIVLRGPDGKVKDERKPRKSEQREDHRHGARAEE